MILGDVKTVFLVEHGKGEMMSVEIVWLVAIVNALVGGFLLGRWHALRSVCMNAEVEGELPKIDPLEESELVRVGMMREDDPAVTAPLHIAESMRTAKCLALGDSINGIVPSTERVAESVWMAWIGALRRVGCHERSVCARH